MALTEVELLSLLSGDGGSVAASANVGGGNARGGMLVASRLEAWLRDTAPDAAAEQLSRALHTAARNRRTNAWFRGAVGAVLGTTLLTAAAAVKHGHPPSGLLVTVAPWLAPLFLAAGVRNAAEVNAALMLGRLGDGRSVPTLAAAWRAGGDPRVAFALRELLDGPLRRAQETGEVGPQAAAALRPLVRTVAAPTVADMPEADTDLLLAVVRYLARTGDPVDRDTLEQAAHAPLARPAATPNRVLVREAARLAAGANHPIPCV